MVIFLISVFLALSRVLEVYPIYEMIQTVERIATIVIVTRSSGIVSAFLFLILKNIPKKYYSIIVLWKCKKDNLRAKSKGKMCCALWKNMFSLEFYIFIVCDSMRRLLFQKSDHIKLDILQRNFMLHAIVLHRFKTFTKFCWDNGFFWVSTTEMWSIFYLDKARFSIFICDDIYFSKSTKFKIGITDMIAFFLKIFYSKNFSDISGFLHSVFIILKIYTYFTKLQVIFLYFLYLVRTIKSVYLLILFLWAWAKNWNKP